MKNSPLHNDIDQLKTLLRQQPAWLRQYAGQVAGYEQEIERLKAQLDKLRRMLFGQSSEKSRNKRENKIRQAEKRLAELENRLAAAKRCLQDDEPAVGTVEQAEPPVAVAPQDRPARRSRCQKLPADLPRETRRITPTETVCPKCGGDLKVMSETVSEQLEIIRSAFKVIVANGHQTEWKSCCPGTSFCKPLLTLRSTKGTYRSAASGWSQRVVTGCPAS